MQGMTVANQRSPRATKRRFTRSSTMVAMSLPPFERVVDEHGPAVLRVCRALLGAHDAQDAWSETFLAALSAYPRLRPNSNVRAWLLTIARNKGIDLVRTRASSPIPVDPTSELVGAAPQDEPLAAGLDAGLIAAVAALPEKQRTAVAYHYLAELPYVEVGKLIGSSEAAARRSAADGLASLRATLRKEDL
jgi:RNA polymerase sigma factor (sigma-70 family)